MNRIGRCGGRERAGEKRGDGRWGARERTRDGKTRVFFDLGAVSFFPEVAPRFSFFFSFFIFAGAGFVVGKGELKWFRSDDAVEVDEGPAVAAPSSPLLLSASTSSRASFFSAIVLFVGGLSENAGCRCFSFFLSPTKHQDPFASLAGSRSGKERKRSRRKSSEVLLFSIRWPTVVASEKKWKKKTQAAS